MAMTPKQYRAKYGRGTKGNKEVVAKSTKQMKDIKEKGLVVKIVSKSKNGGSKTTYTSLGGSKTNIASLSQHELQEIERKSNQEKLIKEQQQAQEQIKQEQQELKQQEKRQEQLISVAKQKQIQESQLFKSPYQKIQEGKSYTPPSSTIVGYEGKYIRKEKEQSFSYDPRPKLPPGYEVVESEQEVKLPVERKGGVTKVGGTASPILITRAKDKETGKEYELFDGEAKPLGETKTVTGTQKVKEVKQVMSIAPEKKKLTPPPSVIGVAPKRSISERVKMFLGGKATETISRGKFAYPEELKQQVEKTVPLFKVRPSDGSPEQKAINVKAFKETESTVGEVLIGGETSRGKLEQYTYNKGQEFSTKTLEFLSTKDHTIWERTKKLGTATKVGGKYLTGKVGLSFAEKPIRTAGEFYLFGKAFALAPKVITTATGGYYAVKTVAEKDPVEKVKIAIEGGVMLGTLGLGYGATKLLYKFVPPVKDYAIRKGRILKGKVKAGFKTPQQDTFKYVTLKRSGEFVFGKQGEVVGTQTRLKPLDDVSSALRSEQATFLEPKLGTEFPTSQPVGDPIIDVRVQTRLSGFGAKTPKIKQEVELFKVELKQQGLKKEFSVTERNIQQVQKKSNQLELVDYKGVPQSVAKHEGLFDVPTNARGKQSLFESKKAELKIESELQQPKSDLFEGADYFNKVGKGKTKTGSDLGVEPIKLTSPEIKLTSPNLGLGLFSLPSLKEDSEIKRELIPAVKRSNLFDESYKQEQIPKQKREIDFVQAQEPIQEVEQKKKIVPELEIKQDTKPVDDIFPKEETTYYDPVPKEKPIKPRPFGFGLPELEENKQKGSESYNVYVKEKGKFVRVKSRLTERQALSLGSEVVDNSSAKTFRVSRNSKPPIKSDEGGLYWQNNQNKFRTYKIKKGKKQPLTRTYIEKRGFGIDTQGELDGITAKGWLAKRRKSKSVFARL